MMDYRSVLNTMHPVMFIIGFFALEILFYSVFYEMVCALLEHLKQLLILFYIIVIYNVIIKFAIYSDLAFYVCKRRNIFLKLCVLRYGIIKIQGRKVLYTFTLTLRLLRYETHDRLYFMCFV